MEVAEYRVQAKEAVDYIADYLENIRERPVAAHQSPGFLQKVLPTSAPQKGETWEEIMEDIDKLIMPGCVHWQSPYMNAYYPAMTTYPCIMGEMVSDAVGTTAFNYASCPAASELEVIVTNWMGRMIGLPEDFLHSKNGTGGGVTQTTVSECTLVSLLAARSRAIKKYQGIHKDAKRCEILGKLVAYSSDQAHSSVEKGARIGFVPLRKIECDGSLSMRGPALLEIMEKDRQNGLIPFWVCATLGTTSSCAFDNLAEVVEVCEGEDVWVHVDAAYAGNALTCPEFRSLARGIEKVDSLVVNASKGMLATFDCSVLWVKDSKALNEAFVESPQYLQNEYTGVAIDFMDWQIPFSRQFRALKLWCVLRNYGVTGAQKYIRHVTHLAGELTALISSDSRFEIPYRGNLGVVVFALTAGEAATELLTQALDHRKKIYCISTILKGRYVVRAAIKSQHTTMADVVTIWEEIRAAATAVLERLSANAVGPKSMAVAHGRCLLLANTVTRPKLMDASFMALHHDEDDLHRWFAAAELTLDIEGRIVTEGPHANGENQAKEE